MTTPSTQRAGDAVITFRIPREVASKLEFVRAADDATSWRELLWHRSISEILVRADELADRLDRMRATRSDA